MTYDPVTPIHLAKSTEAKITIPGGMRRRTQSIY
jgi:hypothetical protein